MQQLERSGVLFPVVPLYLCFLTFLGRGQLRNRETGSSKVNHHFTAFVQRRYRNIFQLHGKWKFMLRTDS